MLIAWLVMRDLHTADGEGRQGNIYQDMGDRMDAIGIEEAVPSGEKPDPDMMNRERIDARTAKKVQWIFSSGVLIRKRCSPQGDSTGDCSVLPGEGCGTSGKSIPVKSIYQIVGPGPTYTFRRG